MLKLSDLYGLSLDDLLREDMELRKKMEARENRVKRYCFWLHDLAMLLFACAIPLAWLEKTSLLIAVGVAGILLICGVHWAFVFQLGANAKTMALRSLAMVTWFSGWLIRVGSHHEMPVGDILWFAGLSLDLYVDYRMDWELEFPRHMTAFTGFVIALALVFGMIPFVGDSVARGDHVEHNPFNSRDYRVTEVLAGEEDRIPMAYLGSSTYVSLDYPGDADLKLEGGFTYITQPEGAKTKGIWEHLDGELLYRVTVEADDSVTMACLENGLERWKYRLEPAPTMGCTVLDVLGSSVGSISWYYDGTFSATEPLRGHQLRGKGTVKLSVPGSDPTVTIHEEFRDGNAVERRTMTLTKDDRGFVEFYRETRQDGGNQTGIYRVPYQDGEFVLVVNYVK